MITVPTMPINSAGILMYRRSGEGIEVLLVHPGGPFWRKRDLALQLRSWKVSESMGNHDSEIVDAGSVD